MLHVRHLPDFGGTIRAADAELLLSYLLAPYLRVPLLIRFFAQPAHTQALARPALQLVLLTLPLTLTLPRTLTLAGPRPARATRDPRRRALRAWRVAARQAQADAAERA